MCLDPEHTSVRCADCAGRKGQMFTHDQVLAMVREAMDHERNRCTQAVSNWAHAKYRSSEKDYPSNTADTLALLLLNMTKADVSIVEKRVHKLEFRTPAVPAPTVSEEATP